MTEPDDRQRNESPASLARTWLGAWERHDMDLLRRLLHPDFVHTSPFGRFEGAEEYLRVVEPLSRKSVLGITVKDVIESEGRAAITYELETPAGRVETCDWVFVAGGRIREVNAYYDSTTNRAALAGSDSTESAPPAAGGVRPGYSRVTPYLNYEDTDAMMAWLADAFGLEERHCMRGADGKAMHAEMTFEGAVVMMGTPAGEFKNPLHLGQSTHSLYVYASDLEALYARATAAGAEVIEEPADQDYGDRRFGVRDPEGHRWYFASPSGKS